MGEITSRAMDTAGGVVSGGVKGGLIGAALTIAIPAVIVGGIGVALGLVGGWAITGGLIGVAVGGVLGAAAAPSGAGLGAAIGGLWRGTKRVFGMDKPKEIDELSQQLEAERARGAQLEQLRQARMATLNSFPENTAATDGHADKLAAEKAPPLANAGKTTPNAANADQAQMQANAR